MSLLHTCLDEPSLGCDARLAVMDERMTEEPDLLAEAFQAHGAFTGPAEAPITLSFGQFDALVRHIRELDGEREGSVR